MEEDPLLLATGISYSPSALLQLCGNALTSSALKKIIQLRGIYQPGRGASYGGNYYDNLRDEMTEAQVTLVVPAILRVEMVAGKTIACQAYLTKKVVLAGGRIEFHAHITELLEQTAGKYSEGSRRALEVQQEKSRLGYRDVEGFVKSRIVQQERVSVTVLIGKTAIIDSDIRHALGEATGFFDMRFERIGLSSEREILDALKRYNDGGLTDLLVLSRGGGENMGIFDNCTIAEACVDLEPLFLTAIGHKEDTSLVQRIADKAFITPTDFGQWLRGLYNDAVAEMEHSKAKLVEAVTRQLRAGYEREVAGLRERVGVLQVQQGEKDLALVRARKEAEEYCVRARRWEAKVRSAAVWGWVKWLVVAAVAGWVGWWMGRG